jgi:hypothetical protein
LIDPTSYFPEAETTNVIQRWHKNNFISAIITAFSEHFPLALRPQHFWILILQAISRHVDDKHEEVRSKWVAHDGKKKLTVRCDEFVLGKAGNNWASVVDGKPDCFKKQIEDNLVEGLKEELVPDFSGTTAVESIAI